MYKVDSNVEDKLWFKKLWETHSQTLDAGSKDIEDDIEEGT